MVDRLEEEYLWWELARGSKVTKLLLFLSKQFRY